MNGNNPVAVVFAREMSEPLTSLVKKLDAAAVSNKSAKMGSFVVFCSDDESLEKKLKDFAKNEKLEKVVLTIDNPSGPPSYKIAKDADVTVLLYSKKEVKVNHAFKKGELSEKDIGTIVSDLSKILPEKGTK
jgi:hypothetical protein